VGLTGPSSGTAQLYKAFIQPFCRSQYVDLSQVHQCVNKEMDMGAENYIIFKLLKL